jgi:hypothetical protein
LQESEREQQFNDGRADIRFQLGDKVHLSLIEIINPRQIWIAI